MDVVDKDNYPHLKVCLLLRVSSNNRRHPGSGHSARGIGLWVVPGQQPEAQGAAVTLGVGAGLVVQVGSGQSHGPAGEMRLRVVATPEHIQSQSSGQQE